VALQALASVVALPTHLLASDLVPALAEVRAQTFGLCATLDLPWRGPHLITQCGSDPPGLIARVYSVNLLFGPPGKIACGPLLELSITCDLPTFSPACTRRTSVYQSALY
jgi:hypothetical protein